MCGNELYFDAVLAPLNCLPSVAEVKEVEVLRMLRTVQ